MAPADPALRARLGEAAVGVPTALRGDPETWRGAAIRAALRQTLQQERWDDVAQLAASYDSLLEVVPVEAEGVVRLQRTGNAGRRHRGAFSTPPDYADDLARRALPAPATTVVDPACGAGALLRAALRRLLALGVPVEVAAGALHGVDLDPLAVELARAALAADLSAAGLRCEPGDFAQVLVVGDALVELDWAAAFPAVLGQAGCGPDPVTGWRGGFDAVLANPPWERLKVHARDWSGLAPEGLRQERAAHARALRTIGRHPLTGAGELNAYLPFVETCWRLLHSAGRAAVLVPAGIASDRSAGALIEELVRHGALRRLDVIEPTEPVFTGVGTRLPVAVLELAVRGDSPARVAIGLASPAEDPRDREFTLDARLLRTVNPNTGTAPLCRSADDARLLLAVHERVPVLRAPPPEPDEWQVRLVTSLHMTRDARWFATAPGPGLVPLYEAKHCALLDPGGGSAGAHRYWVPAEVMAQRYGALWERGWLAGFRNVSTTAAARTLLPTPLPQAGVGNSLPLIAAARLPLLLAALATLPVDYLLRQRHAGANVNFFKLEQVPVPPPSAYDAPAPWAPGTTVAGWVLARLAEAVVWPTHGLEALAAELGVPYPVAAALPSPVRRLQARADLDAAHAALLGLDRDELTHVLGSFTALSARETRATGHFETADRVLAAYDRIVPP